MFTFLGNSVFSGFQWGLLIVLAKLSSPEVLGTFAGAMAIAMPVFLLASLQLRGLLATDAREEFGFNDYLSLRAVTSVLAFAIVCAVAALLPGSATPAAVLMAVGVNRLVDSMHDVLYGLFQKRELMGYVAWSMSLRGLIGFAFSAAVFWWSRELAPSILAGAFGWLLVLLAYDVRRAAALRGSIPSGDEPARDRIVALAWLALPMGGVLALASLSENLPRYVIEHSIGLRELGFYAAAASIAQMAQTVVSAVSSSAGPRLARYHAERNLAAFRSLFSKMLLLGLAAGGVMVAVAVLAGRWILTTLFTEEYAAYASVLVLLMILSVFRYQGALLGATVTSTRQFRVQFGLQLARVACIGGLSLLLVDRFGLYGVIAALFVGAIVVTVSYGWVVYRSMTKLAESPA